MVISEEDVKSIEEGFRAFDKVSATASYVNAVSEQDSIAAMVDANRESVNLPPMNVEGTEYRGNVMNDGPTRQAVTGVNELVSNVETAKLSMDDEAFNLLSPEELGLSDNWKQPEEYEINKAVDNIRPVAEIEAELDDEVQKGMSDHPRNVETEWEEGDPHWTSPYDFPSTFAEARREGEETFNWRSRHATHPKMRSGMGEVYSAQTREELEAEGLSDFGKAFKTARRQGQKTFEWNGKEYNTKIKWGEDARNVQNDASHLEDIEHIKKQQADVVKVATDRVFERYGANKYGIDYKQEIEDEIKSRIQSLKESSMWQH